MKAKLAILAKQNTNLSYLLDPKREKVQLPLEPNYESTITGSSAQTEGERLARNAQLKMNWKMCGDKPRNQADHTAVSMFYLRLGTEGRRIICSKYPQLKMDILTTVELWKIMEDTFIRPRNIQREFLRETVGPAQALRLAINTELGQRNQLQISNGQPCK